MAASRTRLLLSAIAAVLLAAAAPAAPSVKDGVEAWNAKDYEGAVRIWQPLAEAGNLDAQYNMGQAYKMGRGVPVDAALARGWYERAAKAGHAKAEISLGIMLYQAGQMVEAMPWIAKSAERGEARAQYVLGTAMFNGDYAKKDWPVAYALMMRAAAQGVPAASQSLVEMQKYLSAAEQDQGAALAARLERAQKARASGTASASASPPRAAPAVAMKPAERPGPVQVASGGAWRVQLGAYDSPALARSQWARLNARIPALAGFQPAYEAAGALTRLRVGPLANRAAADRLCASTKAAGQDCFAVSP